MARSERGGRHAGCGASRRVAYFPELALAQWLAAHELPSTVHALRRTGVRPLLAAAAELDVPIKLVTCLGFGIDAYHGVNHVHVLENLAALDRDGGYLGAVSIPSGSREAALYCDTALVRRLSGPTLFVNPLMAMYFTVDLAALADRCLYLDRLAETTTVREVEAQIEQFRSGVARRAARVFPH